VRDDDLAGTVMRIASGEPPEIVDTFLG